MATSSIPTYQEVIAGMATDESSQGILQTLLASIVENVTKSMKVKGCSLALLTPDRKFLRHMASCGLSEDYIKKGRILAQKSIADTLKGESVIVYDVSQDERIQYPDQAMREGIASILAVPICLENECIGVLRVYTSTKRRFTEDDIYFARTAANLGASAIERAILEAHDPDAANYESFQRKLVEMEWGRWPTQCP